MLLSELDDEIVSHRLFADEARARAVFARLRAEDPVHLTQAGGYPPFWAVTKLADVTEVERQNDRFLNAPLVFLLDREEYAQRMRDTNGTGQYLRSLVNMDGTEHRAMRGLTQAWFMPHNLKRLDALVRSRATEMMDLMARTGQCDFAQSIAPWYPLRVIMSLLGMPEEHHPDLLRLTQQLLAPREDQQQRDSAEVERAKKQTFGEFATHFQTLIAQRRAEPRDDLATLLVQSQVDGRPLGPQELLGYFLIVATAGHDTTASSLASGLLALLQHPEQLARLRREPQLLGSAVEEILRWSSPVRHFMRTAQEDYVLRGRQIRKGDYLMMCYPSASFDEEVFPDGHLFRIDRTPNRHLAFGFGVHACLGQHLARMELKAFLTEFLARVEDVRIDGPVTLVASNQVSGPKHLPLRYTMAAA
ncbi:cytochrome P450 [Pseudacidovorax sp. 1753]|uniref:cytochrome P450 n=1 Tax=Pseudacidovorax sp. 1753 TaxID=3156419 RepID=UPI003395D33C